MTLIITEVSRYGIVMVADSAVTSINEDTGEIHSIEENGATKLSKIDYLNAGISWWGLGTINQKNTEEWLNEFIEQNKNDCRSISDFANRLEKELRNILGNINTELGFHLAGYENTQQGNLPLFYHITNSAVNNCFDHTTKEFDAQKDYTPEKQEYNKENPYWLTRNGDYFLYANISERLQGFFNQLATIHGVIIPGNQSLNGREEYLRFYMEMIKKIFSISNLEQTIGGKVASLKIDSNGIRDYKIE